METQIIWTAFAKQQLKEIFEYYHEHAGLRTASKIVTQLTLAPKQLVNFPELGEIATSFLGKKLIRSFLEGNYKILYYLNQDNNIIVLDVFDTRQNPTKIKRSQD